MPDSPSFLTDVPGNTGAYNNLLDLVRSGEAIGLVGAGASAGLYPIWPQLIRRLADVAGEERGVDPASRDFWISQARDDPQEIVSLIRTQIGGSRYREVLNEVFQPRRGDDGNAFTPAQAALMHLPFRGFVTTNYDSGLLDARTRFRPDVPAASWATWKNTAAVADWITGKVFSDPCPILFIHGIHQDLDTIVLNSEDYDAAYGEQFARLFETLWIRPGLVFVGFGFSDPWWKFLSQRVIQHAGVQHARGPGHVAIVGLAPGEPYTKERRELFRMRYNAEVVFYRIKALEGGGQDHGELLDVLNHLRGPLDPTPPDGDAPRKPGPEPLPKPPEPYKPHPYLLLDNQRGLIGRKGDLKRLDEWAGAEAGPAVLTMHAIGGTGKSALTWTWFDALFQGNRRPPGGGFWYSFYEKGASFADFIRKAHAYFVRGDAPKPPDGQSAGLLSLISPLLKALDAARCVVVLDGFERLLVAYARIDVLHSGDEASDHASDGDAESADPSKRRSIDHDVDLFLEFIKQHKKARYLITSRLVPVALQNDVGGDLPGTRAVRLGDLSDQDVLDLFHAYGVRGDDDLMLAVTRPFGNHALLVKLLAKTVVRDRSALGDFAVFRAEHPGFDPASIDVADKSRTHVLLFAIGQLSPDSRRVLEVIATFRSAQRYATIKALVGQSQEWLDKALDDLDDFGLLACDREDRTYDLHPLVRNVVWKRLTSNEASGLAREHRTRVPRDPDSGGHPGHQRASAGRRDDECPDPARTLGRRMESLPGADRETPARGALRRATPPLDARAAPDGRAGSLAEVEP